MKILFYTFSACIYIFSITSLVTTYSHAKVTSTSTITSITSENLQSQLQTLFHDHPELILNVLREHSEIILEIAQQGSKQRQHKSLIAQWEKDKHIPKNMHLEHRPIRGSKTAPVTIIAFSDFTCHYCAQAATTIKKILDDYDGTVKYIFKHFPMKGQNISQLAASYYTAASFQNEEKTWIFYDILLERREQILEQGEAALRQAAKDAGLDTKKLATDLKRPEINTILGQDFDDAEQIDVTGTPYFLVNNLILRGSLPQELFIEAINMNLNKN